MIIYSFIIIITSTGLVVLNIVQTSEVRALTLPICCQRQDVVSRQEKQKAVVEKGWGSKNQVFEYALLECLFPKLS